MANQERKKDQLRQTLERLRCGESDSRNVEQATLGLIYDQLPRDEPSHWFCSQAPELTREAAKFCVRMFAYDGPRAKDWKSRLFSCLRSCVDCVLSFQEAKVSTRRTYFGAFSDDVLETFYAAFVQWECTIISEYASSDLLVESSSRQSENPSEWPSALIYYMLSDARISQNAKITAIIREHISNQSIDGWPKDTPPAGLFLLLMNPDSQVRTWARQQLSTYTSSPMPREHFIALHADAFAVASNIMGAGPLPTSLRSLPSQYTQDVHELWSAYSAFLRYIPADSIPRHIRDLVVSHLSDTGSHFEEVLKTFVLLINRLGLEFWKDEPEGYPSVVFNTIKDNSAYTELLRTLNSDMGSWILQWIESYVKTLDVSSVNTVLPLVMQFLCEGLQHEMYENVRHNAIQVAAKIFYVVLLPRKHPSDENLQTTDVVWQTLDIHAAAITSVAFGRSAASDKWREAHFAARKLVRLATKMDTKTIASAIIALSRPSQPGMVIAIPQIREELWRKMYEAMTANDIDAVADIIELIAPIAHVGRLLDDAYADVFRRLDHRDEAKKALKATNHTLDVLRNGSADQVSKYVDLCNLRNNTALDLLQRPGIVNSIMFLMFSPMENIRESAQSIIGAAFDVDSRPDCFRALLLNFPNGAIDGMTSFLDVFATHASTVPEACSVSKSLALCFTDIIDVLCSTPNGLLHQTNFLKSIKAPGPEGLLPQWWSLMAKALVVIFQRTPRWSNYFDNEVMITWMRDALIFGRDMLAQRKVIEGAALTFSQGSSKRRISDVRKKMVGDLQQVLLELTRWLRLTDEELLHQAFALLQVLLSCFKETGIPPEEGTLQKLQKHVNDARKSDSDVRTRLDSARLSRLQEAISSFTAPDDEIEIIEPPPPPPPPPISDDEIQIVAHISKKPEKVIRPEASKAAKASKALAPAPTPVPKPVQKPVQAIQQLRRQPGKPSLTGGFSREDQTRLDAAASIPKFKRSKPAHGGSDASEVEWDKTSTASSVVPGPSDSEESDDEDGMSLEQMARKPVVKKPVERRRVMMIDMPTNAKNPALERLNKKDEARRTALRLKPDISSLHRTILSWDHEYNGPQPPGQTLQLLYVPDRFPDVSHYRRVFEPLLLMECWAQLQQSKEEPSESYESRVVNRQYTDDWVDIDIMIMESVQKDWTLMDTDIVLMKSTGNQRKHLAKVQSTKRSPTGLQATVRFRLSESNHGPQSNTVWSLSKVFSLITLHREYAALMGLPYYDLCQTILKAELSRPVTADSRSVNQTMTSYSLNEPQAKAVASALRTDGFSLIQGPPGTGKTSTICGLVQAFIAQRPKPVTSISVGRNAGPSDKEPPKKILLCAPSNAAIDEITFRLKEGVSGPGRRVVPPKVVRVGAPKSINVSVKDVSLDALVEQKLNDDPATKNSNKDSGSEIALLRADLDSVKRLRQQKFDEISTIHDNTAKTLALEEEIKKLNKQKTIITHQLDKLRDKQKSDYRTLDAISRRYRAEVFFEADVICSTLAGAGHELLESFDFELVVIDEAAQAIELSSLIPLKYRCNRCVMVGDPQQLPPTVISQEASKYGYNQSLFVRLQKHRPDAVHLLSIQYRMHPQISLLPSRMFYDGRLVDGPDMTVKTQRPWHMNTKFGPYRFFNISGVEENGPFRSLINQAEVQVAIALFNRIRQEYTSYDFDSKVGIVTMYRAQVRELRRAFEKRFGQSITGVVDFNTVDGFQGQEKDIIILSCVRAGPNLQKIGFLADVRRMNVALTRAKASVFILGNAATLERSDANWKQIVHDARERSLLVDANVAYFTASRSVPAKPAVQPMKPKPASSTGEQSLPALATPRELASAVSRVRETKARYHETDGDSTVLASTATPTTEPTRAGQKRPADEVGSSKESGNTVKTHKVEEQRQKPQPKKQKQAPNLFIPKKRPPPPNGDSGPPYSRRRT